MSDKRRGVIFFFLNGRTSARIVFIFFIAAEFADQSCSAALLCSSSTGVGGVGGGCCCCCCCRDASDAWPAFAPFAFEALLAFDGRPMAAIQQKKRLFRNLPPWGAIPTSWAWKNLGCYV